MAKQPQKGFKHSTVTVEKEFYLSIDFLVTDEHDKYSELLKIDGLLRGGYGSECPAIVFGRGTAPTVLFAANGNKMEQFKFSSCELDRWYNLTLVQEPINSTKYMMTGRLTSLRDPDEEEFAAATTVHSMINYKPFEGVVNGNVWLCSPRRNPANALYRNFKIKYGDDCPPTKEGKLINAKEKTAPATDDQDDDEDEDVKKTVALDDANDDEEIEEREITSFNGNASTGEVDKAIQEVEKAMLLIGTSQYSSSKQVVALMEELKDDYHDVQMVKVICASTGSVMKYIQGQIMTAVLSASPTGRFSLPVMTFWENGNLVDTVMGAKLLAVKDSLAQLSKMVAKEEAPIDLDDEYEAAYEAGLNEHNRLRALHADTPPMILSPKICLNAQKYAEKLVAQGGNLKHSSHTERPGEGENLAYNYASNYEGAIMKAVEMWYEEIKDYNYKSPGFGHKTGHFTQVIWVTSTKLGLGVAKRKQGGYMVVGRYTQPGNFNNAFTENVKPLK